MSVQVPDLLNPGPNRWPSYRQPDEPTGSFSPAATAPVCPKCGVQTKPTGGGDFEFRCQACGIQVRGDGQQQNAHVHALPLVVRPNAGRS
jgi:hypothetical protein